MVIVKVIQQNDPENNPDDTMTLYHAALVKEDGIYMDIDYIDENSGPYIAEPTTEEIADFLADPTNVGQFVEKN